MMRSTAAKGSSLPATVAVSVPKDFSAFQPSSRPAKKPASSGSSFFFSLLLLGRERDVDGDRGHRRLVVEVAQPPLERLQVGLATAHLRLDPDDVADRLRPVEQRLDPGQAAPLGADPDLGVDHLGGDVLLAGVRRLQVGRPSSRPVNALSKPATGIRSSSRAVLMSPSLLVVVSRSVTSPKNSSVTASTSNTASPTSSALERHVALGDDLPVDGVGRAFSSSAALAARPRRPGRRQRPSVGGRSRRRRPRSSRRVLPPSKKPASPTRARRHRCHRLRDEHAAAKRSTAARRSRSGVRRRVTGLMKVRRQQPPIGSVLSHRAHSLPADSRPRVGPIGPPSGGAPGKGVLCEIDSAISPHAGSLRDRHWSAWSPHTAPVEAGQVSGCTVRTNDSVRKVLDCVTLNGRPRARAGVPGHRRRQRRQPLGRDPRLRRVGRLRRGPAHAGRLRRHPADLRRLHLRGDRSGSRWSRPTRPRRPTSRTPTSTRRRTPSRATSPRT